jgi:adenylate cyclase
LANLSGMSKSFLERRKLIRVLIVIAGSCLAAFLVFVSAPLFERVGWPVYDFFQRHSQLTQEPDVALIYITQGSLDELQNNPETAINWPWPREVYGLMAKTAAKLDAKSLTYDITFTSPSLYGVEDDKSFNESLKEAKLPIVMAGGDSHHMKDPIPTITAGLGSQLALGLVTIPQEADGVYRKMPNEIGGRKPLAFAAVPRKENSSLWMRFYKPGVIPVVEASEVFHLFRDLEDGKDLSSELKAAAEKLKSRHWIVGAAAPGLLDLKPTPVDPYAPGPLVHATALANVIDHEGVLALSNANGAFVSIVLAVFTFAILLFSSTPVPALIGASLASIIGPFVFGYGIWQMGYWLNPIPLLFANGVLSLCVLGIRFQLEWRERQRLAKTVSNAMSADMVEMVRKGQMQLSRFGERREISIFFCDLSGFTTISEKLEASQLVDVLNLYLDEVVRMIFDNKGFVDKFIGDAVMALWGAPVTAQTDHAKLAVASAVQFSETMRSFREKARLEVGDLADVLTARAGVHTGIAIVGHIGSQHRHNYTAIGDSVNLASRLEGIGKQYDCELLVSEDALIAASRLLDPNFIEVDVIAVKGRSTPTKIYTYASSAPESEKTAYKHALEAYRAADFGRALELFETAPSIHPYKKMGDRCRQALTSGTPKSFRNGVWHFDEK